MGAEIQKTRPAVVEQTDIFNQEDPRATIIAPFTSNTRPPLHVTRILVRAREGGLDVDSVILMRQLRVVDTQRFIRRLGRVSAETMRQVDDAQRAAACRKIIHRAAPGRFHPV